MLKEERQRKIVELVESHGKVTVEQLTSQFNVSDMTIRRDLKRLDEIGWIERTHGGALLAVKHHNRLEPPPLERMHSMAAEKERIAEAVAELVGPEETIFLGSGTTTLYVAHALADRDDITIVTNALQILSELARDGKMTLIGVGGFLRREELSLVGHFADSVIKNMRVNKVIMGMRGIHPHFGLTNEHLQELMTDRAIMGISDNVIIVADHTKIGHVSTSRTADVTASSLIVTTHPASPKMVEAIQQQGVEVLQV